ncbi:MAG: hypothetical protein QOI85_321 [Chloroflexota bacterium]|nr:hypothetical protein [Chloroflexota bacterium]
MARTVLLIGAVVFLLAGAGTFALAAIGVRQLLSLLPPLAIDADAVGGALTALALTLVAAGTAHLFVATGLRDGRRWARSAGALLAGVLAPVFVGLAAAAVSSALRSPGQAPPLLAGAALATFAAIGYTLAAVRLAREMGSGSAS